MKQIAGIVLVLAGLVLGFTAQAASFDCAKATTKVEKLICGNPTVSKLDDELGKVYQETISKANEEQKQQLLIEQKHWLKHTRNVCKDETCLKLAYWSRQAGLATFFEPKSQLYKHEGEKAEAIKQILATAPLYLSEGALDAPFCNQMFDDLKQMKDVRFVDPVVQTQSYEDPALDKWKGQLATKLPLNFSYWCDARLTRGYIVFGKKGLANALTMCNVGFGLPPFKLYELPPVSQSGAKRHIFYTDDGYGPMNKDWEKPSLGGKSAGFQQVDVTQDEHGGAFADASRGGRNGENYNSIIEYKKQYYFLVLNKVIPPNWGLDVRAVVPSRSKEMKSCRWSFIDYKSHSLDQGSK